MNKLLYGITLQWKIDLRNKGIILTYYIVPIVFFIFMSGIFTSINPEAYKTLIASMTVFGVTMGAFCGYPVPILEIFSSDIKKSYKVSGIPLWTVIFNNFISAFIHLYIVSIIIFIVAKVAFKAEVPVSISSYFISLALFIIASLSVGTTMGLLIKNQAKLTMVSQLVFLPSIMLSGIMFPADMLPNMLINLGKIVPATWGFESLTNSSLSLNCFLALLVIFIVCTSISLYKLKENNIEN